MAVDAVPFSLGAKAAALTVVLLEEMVPLGKDEAALRGRGCMDGFGYQEKGRAH